MIKYFKRPVHQLIVVMPLQETKVINQSNIKYAYENLHDINYFLMYFYVCSFENI